MYAYFFAFPVVWLENEICGNFTMLGPGCFCILVSIFELPSGMYLSYMDLALKLCDIITEQ